MEFDQGQKVNLQKRKTNKRFKVKPIRRKFWKIAWPKLWNKKTKKKMNDEVLRRALRSSGCRLCLAPDTECVPIFATVAADKEPLSNKIFACVNIKVSKNSWKIGKWPQHKKKIVIWNKIFGNQGKRFTVHKSAAGIVASWQSIRSEKRAKKKSFHYINCIFEFESVLCETRTTAPHFSIFVCSFGSNHRDKRSTVQNVLIRIN